MKTKAKVTKRDGPGGTDWKHEHPSYGTISLHRASVGGGGADLFMSSVKNGNVVVLEICHADRTRASTHSDYVHSKDPIVQIYMSELQFAQAITSFGIGGGVPCTINRINNQAVEDCPPDTRFREFNAEIKLDADETSSDLDELRTMIDELVEQPRVNKSQIRDLASKMDKVLRDLKSNVPFLAKQIQEHTEDVINDAQAQIDGHILDRVQRLGLGSLAEAQRAGVLSISDAEPEAIEAKADDPSEG